MEHNHFAPTSFKMFELDYIINLMCVLKSTEFIIMGSSKAQLCV